MRKANIVREFTNYEDGVTSFVIDNLNGTYNVSMQDNDAGEFMSAVYINMTLDAAIEKAKQILGRM